MVGSNLTDLGRNQLGYNDNATRLAIAQAQAKAATDQANAERFWRQQQSQQANELQRQQLAQNDFFNRGRLTNQAQANVANTAAAEAERFWQSSENDKNRANQLAVAGLRNPTDFKTQELSVDQNMFADAVNNFAALLNQKEELGSAKTQIDTASKLQDNYTPFTSAAKRAAIPIAGPVLAVSDFFKNNETRKNAPFAALPYNYPANPDLPVAENIKGATAFFDQKLSELDKIIEAGQKEGLGSHVSRGPNGKWIPTLGTPVSPQATPFFNAPAPAMTNAPAVVPPPMTNTPVAVAPATNSPALQRWIYVPGQGLVPR